MAEVLAEADLGGAVQREVTTDPHGSWIFAAAGSSAPVGDHDVPLGQSTPLLGLPLPPPPLLPCSCLA